MGVPYTTEAKVSQIINEKLSTFTVSGGGITEVTTDELNSLLDSSKLSKGSFYRIIDYKPTYPGQNFVMMGHQFDIIVQAIDEKTINKNCRFAHHDGDTYFANNDLDKWEGQIALSDATYKEYVIKATIGSVLQSAFLVQTGTLSIYTQAPTPQNPTPQRVLLYRYVKSAGSLNLPNYFYSTLSELTENSTLYVFPDEVAVTSFEDLVEFGADSIMVSTHKVGIIVSRLIDEFNNDCPYDFKNAVMISSNITNTQGGGSGIGPLGYTFTKTGDYLGWIDNTIGQNSVKNNKIYGDSFYTYFSLPCIVILGSSPNNNTFYNCSNIVINCLSFIHNTLNNVSNQNFIIRQIYSNNIYGNSISFPSNSSVNGNLIQTVPNTFTLNMSAALGTGLLGEYSSLPFSTKDIISCNIRSSMGPVPQEMCMLYNAVVSEASRTKSSTLYGFKWEGSQFVARKTIQVSDISVGSVSNIDITTSASGTITAVISNDGKSILITGTYTNDHNYSMPYTLTFDDAGGTGTYVKKFNGSSWVDVYYGYLTIKYLD